MRPVHEDVFVDVFLCHVWTVVMFNIPEMAELQSEDGNDFTKFKLLFWVVSVIQAFAKN